MICFSSISGCGYSASGLTLAEAGIDGQIDLQRAPLFSVMAAHGSHSLFHKLDLLVLARDYAGSWLPLVEADAIEDAGGDPLLQVHDRMFRAEVLRLRGDAAWRNEEEQAFGILSETVVAQICKELADPTCRIMDDQIVWGRSPARIDLASGWSDTPPYCLEHGGSVMNIVIDFNDGRYKSLEEQLDALGGGIEISMLAAIPKGAGLGTSSILAGTMLGTLSELCDLSWDNLAICARVNALGQMLGSGGGWQDQFGGLLHGAKLVETHPGLDQTPSVRWLPVNYFGPNGLGDRMLLYYTGITRVAHDVLGEIVRGMFLNHAERLKVLDGIRANGKRCFDAIQRADDEEFCASVRKSWELNCALDPGVNPPEVQAILAPIEEYLSAVKLSGVGGGGFMFLIAKDVASAKRIREMLESNPPNSRARFVEMQLSATGMQVTRS